jgi:hypothetical protein
VLLQQLIDDLPTKLQNKVIRFNGDEEEDRQLLQRSSKVTLEQAVVGAEVVAIDEGQRIKNIGLSLKILIDNFPEKIYYLTGSSSLTLARGVQEALTGRNLKYRLYPLSTRELTRGKPEHQKATFLSQQLLFGGYPYLTHLNKPQEKKLYLKSVVDDYLFKDLTYLAEVDYPDLLEKLARLLAFQIGSEVSYNELANSLGIGVKTVRRYLSLLEQAFIVFKVGAFSKNLRNEVVKSKKYYFWDLGIRNALIEQFMPLDVRDDKGALWENFLVVERLKKHEYQQRLVRHYFWRTYQQAEVDWLEVEEGQMAAFEFKWKKKKARTPKLFRENYGQEVKVVNRDNFLEFVCC